MGQAPQPKALALLLDKLLLDVVTDSGTVGVPGAHLILPLPHDHCHRAGVHLSQGRAWGHGHLPQDRSAFPNGFRPLWAGVSGSSPSFQQTCKQDKQAVTNAHNGPARVSLNAEKKIMLFHSHFSPSILKHLESSTQPCLFAQAARKNSVNPAAYLPLQMFRKMQ